MSSSSWLSRPIHPQGLFCHQGTLSSPVFPPTPGRISLYRTRGVTAGLLLQLFRLGL